jgi:hypothetical protein
MIGESLQKRHTGLGRAHRQDQAQPRTLVGQLVVLRLRLYEQRAIEKVYVAVELVCDRLEVFIFARPVNAAVNEEVELRVVGPKVEAGDFLRFVDRH